MKQVLLLLFTGAYALTVDQRPAGGFLAQEDAAAHVASSLLEVTDTGMQGRQERVESLLSAEQSALLSQEQALEQIAAQQSALAQQQQQLKEREAKVEQEIAQKVSKLDASQVSASMSSASGLEAGVDMLQRWSHKSWKEQLLSPGFYLALVLVGGWVYGKFFTYKYDSLRKEPRIARDDLSFGLFDGFSFDPDYRICCCSCFCLPIRWADTASSPKINFLSFWPGLMLFALMISLINLTYGATALVALVLAVLNRQQIRKLYGLPNRTCGTCTADTGTWLFCGPCAAMQEAMQVEFIDSPLDGTVPQMMQMNSMDKFLTAPATQGQLPAGQRKATQSCC